jgi:hypothetical protein
MGASDMTMKPAMKLGISVFVIVASSLLWLRGWSDSLVRFPERRDEAIFRQNVAHESSPDYQAERTLAEAYWRRYPDVAEDGYFGKTGPYGSLGARKHFTLHGKQEGRIWDEASSPEQNK